MKRSTYAILAVLAALGVVWAVQNRQVTPDAPPPLTLDGLVTAPDAETARNLLREAPPKAMKLTLRRPDGESITLEAAPLAEGVTPEKLAEREFTATRTAGESTTTAKAMSWKAGAMVEVFAAPLRSTFAQTVASKDLAEYGLDAAQAIEVEAQLDGKTFHLRIGAAMKAESDGSVSTWLQAADRPEVVYQVAGQNLREPFAVAWSELRNRQMLAVDAAHIRKIALSNPAGERVVVERPALATGQSREAGDGWQITEPAGLPAGNIGEWVQALKNLSANQFVDAAAAKDVVWHGPDAATLQLEAAETTTLTLAGPVAGVSGEQVWLRVQTGNRTEYAHVAKFARDQLVRRAAQVRDRRLGGALAEADVQSWTLQGPEGSLTATRRDGQWQAANAGNQSYLSDTMGSYLRDLLATQVDYAPDATPTGLDQPEWRVALTTSQGPVEVVVSKEINGAIFGQVRVANKPGDPFAIPSWSAEKIRKTPMHFADKRLLPVADDSITRVVVQPKGGRGFVLERGGDGWQLTDGDAAASPANKANVDAWISALTKLTWKTPAKGAEASLGVANGPQVTIHLRDGTQHVLRFAPAKDNADSAVAVSHGRAAGRWMLAQADASWPTKSAADFR